MTPVPHHTPFISIIVPVRNGAETLENCLRALSRSSYEQREIIVVDDHSSDATAAIARSYGARLIVLDEETGANNARNRGASEAKGEILVFVDADIRVRRDTVLTIVEGLLDGNADAIVGIYTAKHRHESFVSQYKNLWIRYSYLKSAPAIDWLFGAISGIRAEAFRAIGGFDTELLARHGNDDIELGKRLVRANLTIMLDLDVEVEHLKLYTLGSFLQNEFERSRGFARMAKRLGEVGRSMTKGFVNVPPSFIVSSILAIVILVLALAGLVGIVGFQPLAAALGVYFIVNIRFLNYLEQVRGLFAMFAMIPVLFLDHLICSAGSIAGLASITSGSTAGASGVEKYRKGP